MTRDETNALWHRCKTTRADVLAQGKDEEEAHEAAKSVWNSWAASLPARESLTAAEWRAVSLVDFRGVRFPPQSVAHVEEAPRPVATISQPAGELHFEGFSFPGRVNFRGAIFPQAARFTNVTFSGDAEFGRATFSGEADYNNATFNGDAHFNQSKFKGRASFNRAVFSGIANFIDMNTPGDTVSEKATFLHGASFCGATFSGDARFDGRTFSGDADFEKATFLGDAGFADTKFFYGARFNKAIFSDHVEFKQATFSEHAQFTAATFSGMTHFKGATFCGHSAFSAIRATRAFDLANARFDRVPDFIQAHFDEAPRLDNVFVATRMIERLGLLERLRRGSHQQTSLADPDTQARYRALRGLAIQGHDGDRELMFFAGEIRSARFATDWPLPLPPWKREGWSGLVRFWAGIIYELLSHFGRSILLPFVWWCLLLGVFALFYLGQSPDVHNERAHTDLPRLTRYVSVSFAAWWRDQPCWPGEPKLQLNLIGLPEPSVPGPDAQLAPLGEPLRRQTSAATEALHLSLRSAFIVLDSGGESAYRSYACLYGVDHSGGSHVAVVPSTVSFAAALQKVLSGVLIFLFGLGLRNMFKMK